MDQPVQQEVSVTSALLKVAGSLAASRYAKLRSAPPSEQELSAKKLDPELLGNRFTSKDGDVTAESLKGSYIALNFSAAWCPMGPMMNPDVITTYNAIKARIPNFEMILIGSPYDDKASFDKFYGEMPWLALPYDERDMAAALYDRFEKCNIGMVVLDADFNIVNFHAMGELLRDPTGANFPWDKSPVWRRIVRTPEAELELDFELEEEEEAGPSTY